MCKEQRKFTADDIANKQKRNPSPAPNSFRANYAPVLKEEKACLSLKADRVSYLADVEFKSRQMPAYHTKNYAGVDKKNSAAIQLKPRIKEGSDVASFLKVRDSATRHISPTQYKAIESFRKTQVKNLKFGMSPRRDNYIDSAIKKSN